MLAIRLLLLCFLSLVGTRARAQIATPPQPATGAPEDSVSLASRIVGATVFLEGAQVRRTARTIVPAGRTTLVFSGLTADLDPKSVQLNTPADLTILSVSHRLNFSKRTAEDPIATGFYDRLDALDRRKARLTTRYAIAKEEEEILAANRAVAGSTTGLDAEELRATVTFHRERITAIRLLYLALSDSLRTVAEQTERLQKQLAELGRDRAEAPTSEIVVVTQAARQLTADFSLTYLVTDAGWTPHYDVRVADISQPVDLRYRAKVTQSSGEDWSNVKLQLSTGDPSANATAPELPIWRVRPGSRPPVYRPVNPRETKLGYRTVTGRVVDEEGVPLIGASVFFPGASTGTVTDLDGNYSIKVPLGAENVTISYTGFNSLEIPVEDAVDQDVSLNERGIVLDQVVATAGGINRKRKHLGYGVRGKRNAEAASRPVPVKTERRATTVVFDIALPYTIPSDGKARDVDIKQHKLPAAYAYTAVPKHSPDAYLTATLTNWDQYDLLTGPAQLFFEGTYLGLTELDVSTTDDTLRLSLGRDAGVLVERHETTDYRKRSFFGGKVTESRGYEISVRNKKGQPVQLTVLDQVPVSADADVDVRTDLPAGVRHNEETGELKWTFRLPPSAEEEVRFGYTVKSPRNRRVILD